MQGIHFKTPQETAEFQKIMDNVIPRLLGTQQGATLIALLAHENKSVDRFIEKYCAKMESTFTDKAHADRAKEYANSIRTLRAYANQYEQVRDFLSTVSDNLSQVKARPEFLEELLADKPKTPKEPSRGK